MLSIHTYPSEALTQKATEVSGVSPVVREIAREMAALMYAADGLGLAAPQVGRLLRIVVVDCPDEYGAHELLYLINPTITEQSGTVVSKEGCLSFPGLHLAVKRSARVTVEANDLEGERYRIEAVGKLAVCLQHEIDHLDGKTMIDRVPPKVRAKALKKWKRNGG